MSSSKQSGATFEGAASLLADVVRWREFWLNLARTELDGRFRGSVIGLAWLVIQPLAFTAMLCSVFGLLSQQGIIAFSNYVFVGVVFWSWFAESITLGGMAIVNAQSMMRQTRLPLVIFPLKTWIVTTASFLMAFVGVLGWYFATMQQLPGFGALLLLVNIPLLGLVILPFSIAASVLGTLYRDFQQAAVLALQGLWFVSPVFVDKAVFLNPGLRHWDAVNPVSAMLSLLRDPLLSNAVPPLWAYVVTVIFGLFGALVAYQLMRRNQARLIFYV